MVILGTMLGRRLCEEMPFEQRPRSEGVRIAGLWEKHLSEGISSPCKSPKETTKLSYVEAAYVAKAKQINKKLEGNKDGGTNSGQIMEVL